MKAIVFTLADGSAGVCWPAYSAMLPGESEAAFILRVQAMSVPADATGVQVVDAADVPPPVPPAPDPLAAGLAIVSTGTPALNGTYAIHEQAQQNIVAVVTGINAGQGLPGGGATFVYRDTLGGHGPFTADQFIALAKTVRDFVYALSGGAAPTQPVSIP